MKMIGRAAARWRRMDQTKARHSQRGAVSSLSSLRCRLVTKSTDRSLLLGSSYDEKSSSSSSFSFMPERTTLTTATKEDKKQDKDTMISTAGTFLAAGLDPSAAPLAAATTASNAVPAVDPLYNYLMQTIISTAVPSITICSCVGLTVWLLRRQPSSSTSSKGTSKAGKKSKTTLGSRHNPATELYHDLYYDEPRKKKESPLQEIIKFLKESTSRKQKSKKDVRRLNRGMPAEEYISLKHWNQTLDSYQYSVVAATQSKAKAAAQIRSKNFDRALGKALVPAINGDAEILPAWTNHTKRELLELEKEFLKEGSKLVQEINHLQTQLTQNAIDDEMERMGIQSFEMDPPVSDNNDLNLKNDGAASNAEDPASKAESSNAAVSDPDNKQRIKATKQLLNDLNQAQSELMKLELDFVKDIIATMGTQHATGIRVALLGDIRARGSGGLLTQLQERPLTAILEALDITRRLDGETTNDDTVSHDDDDSSSSGVAMTKQKGTLFVTRFSGDWRASQVSKLREEVTAIVRNASPGDEALVVLESGGGTVTGYGLAAGQLQRLKDSGIKLTIAVEQVAASGGYMMCCVADKIIGSPFALFGSIGVITEIPNVYDRLKTEGV
jgi:K+-transporting ATPase c subunit